MARHRTHSVTFKRQVAQEFLAGETLHGLAKRHDLSRNLIRAFNLDVVLAYTYSSVVVRRLLHCAWICMRATP